MRKTNKKGFTIVELVIVIAVIGILATVLIPTFSGIIQDANGVSTQSNIRNAYQEYAIAAGKDVQPTVVLKVDGEFYQVTDGEINFTALENDPAAGTKYWDAEAGEMAHECVDAANDADHACDVEGCTVDNVGGHAWVDAADDDACDTCAAANNG